MPVRPIRPVRPVRPLQFLFRVSVIGFLAGGLLLVLGQTLGIVVGDADWVTAVEEHAGPPTFVIAGISGLIAFALSYLTPGEVPDDSGPSGPSGPSSRSKEMQPTGSPRSR
ncbi:hypothetical protein [Streptomyces daliensis]|uniref:Uncharacterized protein n=1 Tax=Streptomyces daliensis TaxID=299421 RepID=A0A8T4IZU5_9ACTN|nr:hypothetical protein [Streptomyces daliensis]